jgi:structural maintenance of chromosome 4
LKRPRKESRIILFSFKGDLGAIDEKYDTAISTACSSLDSILVDTVDTASKCIEYLKINKVGTATFIALDKQEKFREMAVKQNSSTPENVPRLVDLIKVNNDKFLTAFYYGLRNTLVADNLEQASRIAYSKQRNRVVTLKGEIIEVSGTMSGGGNPVKGKMGNKVVVEAFSEEAIREMRQKYEKFESDLRAIVKHKQDNIEPKIYELKSKLDKSKENNIKWQAEVKSISEQLQTLKKGKADCEKLLKNMVVDEKKKASLEQNLIKLRETYENSDKKSASVKLEIDKLHDMIMSTSKKLLDKPKQSLESVENELKDLNTKITNLNVEIKNSQRNITNSKKKLRSYEEDYETNVANEDNFNKRLEVIDDEGKSLVEQHDKLKAELDELSKEIQEKSKHNKELEKEKQKYENSKIDLNHKLEKHLQNLNQNEGELKHLQNLLRGLKLHDLNALEYEVDSNIDYTLQKYTKEEIDEIDVDSLKDEIHGLENELKQMTPNLSAIQSYIDLVRLLVFALHTSIYN